MSSQADIWDALAPVRCAVCEDAVVERAGVTRATVRRYLRIWELAGYVLVHKYGALGRSIATLRSEGLPYICWDGRVAYVNDPSEFGRHATVDFNTRPPTVNHRPGESET